MSRWTAVCRGSRFPGVAFSAIEVFGLRVVSLRLVRFHLAVRRVRRDAPGCHRAEIGLRSGRDRVGIGWGSGRAVSGVRAGPVCTESGFQPRMYEKSWWGREPLWLSRRRSALGWVW